jgi:hypothetical protein
MAIKNTVGGQGEDSQNSKAKINNSSDNGIDTSKERSAATPHSLVRRATGPRTRQGKETSKHNAHKHGIFSEEVVLKGESREEFGSFQKSLRKAFQPGDAFEHVLVNKLVVSLWRQRRVLIAEVAEIQKGRDSVKWDEEREQEEGAAEILRNPANCIGGLITTIAIPTLLDACLELLAKLKNGISRNGLNRERDREILSKLYGEYQQEDLRNTLFSSYIFWFCCAYGSDEIRQDNLFTSTEKAKQEFVREIEREEKRLYRIRKDSAARASARLIQISLTRNIPASAEMDRLLRYWASIDRDIDRILKQLERHRRIRLGQPLLPPIDLNVALE